MAKVSYVRKFWKVLRQINPYVSNKWPLKLPCAYLNTQQSSRNLAKSTKGNVTLPYYLEVELGPHY
ncbi:hypothetical protein T12_7777 [Trichinella patagoniensis]|uniref:Uncharacterized protein n=1 Tax=Trichinella patagoniensis TaxID=990121 RepID=A0A0V1A019_9BILA|nr:hypothetical protein T12_7777 [Trichinella patagoniensis]